MSGISIERKACARIPTQFGEFQLCLYTNSQDDKEHLAIIMGDIENRDGVLVRIHSECFTGDVLGSRRCDCGEQLQRSMEFIAQAGAGLIIYMRQEGRGIGLLDKLRAYNLQDMGYDTVDANLALGHQPDERDYTIAAMIMKELKVKAVSLMTNNPGKILQLEELGVQVSQRIPLETTIHPDNARYLFTKVQRMDHMLDLNEAPIDLGKSTRSNGSL